VQSNNLDKVSTMSMQMVMKTFPIKFKAVHSFDCIEKKNLFVWGFVQGILSIFVRLFSKTMIHFYSSQWQREREKNVQILEEQHGLTADLLPCITGGTWKYEKFDEWLHHRNQEEKQLHLFDVHMKERSLAIASVSIAHPYSELNVTTWHQPQGSHSETLPIAPEPMVVDGNASPTSTVLHLQTLERATGHLTTLETKAFHDALQKAKPQSKTIRIS